MSTDMLRALVREVVADVVRDLARQETRPGAPPSGLPRAGESSDPVLGRADDTGKRVAWGTVEPTGPRNSAREVHSVTLANDEDLNAFVRHIVHLLDNPKARMDLLAGAIRFTLVRPVAGVVSAVSPDRVHRRERGALTEREVKDAAENGRTILLGRRAVVTPLAREKARALGVTIEKES